MLSRPDRISLVDIITANAIASHSIVHDSATKHNTQCSFIRSPRCTSEIFLLGTRKIYKKYILAYTYAGRFTAETIEEDRERQRIRSQNGQLLSQQRDDWFCVSRLIGYTPHTAGGGWGPAYPSTRRYTEQVCLSPLQYARISLLRECPCCMCLYRCILSLFLSLSLPSLMARPHARCLHSLVSHYATPQRGTASVALRVRVE